MKKIGKILCILMTAALITIITVCSSEETIRAQAYAPSNQPAYLANYKGSFKYTEKSGLDIFGWFGTTYTCNVYQDASQYLCDAKAAVSPTTYHKQGRQDETLEMNVSLTIKKETSEKYSGKLGGSAKGKVFGLTAEFCGEQTNTYGVSFAISSKYNKTILKNDPTGTYVICRGQNHRKLVITRYYKDSSGTLTHADDLTAYYPCGRPFLCLGCNTTNKTDDWTEWVIIG